MRISKTALSAIAMTVASLGASTTVYAQTTEAAPTAETDQNAAIMAFFDEVDAEQLSRSPLGKSYRGIKDSDYGRWDDGSEAAEAPKDEEHSHPMPGGMGGMGGMDM